MSWFKKKPKAELELGPSLNDKIEVAVSKNATKEAFEKADQANQKLNELLVENGFTLKIYLAAGGHYKKKGNR